MKGLRNFALIGCAVLIGLVGSSAIGLVSAHGGDASLIHACVKSNGQIYMSAANGQCGGNETSLDWNMQGVAGPAGPQGAQGIQGIQGIQGEQGPAPSYSNVVVVSPSGGDFTSVQAALNSITTNSSTNRYLVWVGPGTYTETVAMKQWVDIEGAGEKITRITFTGSLGALTGTVVGASNAELRSLTVENTGGADYSTAILNREPSLSLLHVTATASGGNYNFGVVNAEFSSSMNNVTAMASGGIESTGVNNLVSSPSMNNVTASASGGISNYGVRNYFATSLSMNNVTASASGGTESTGVYNSYSSPSMNNVTVKACSASASTGVRNLDSSPTLSNVTVSAYCGTSGVGVSISGGTTSIDNSVIWGSTHSISRSPLSATVNVGASKLNGGPALGGVTCAGVYDENYVFYPSTCP